MTNNSVFVSVAVCSCTITGLLTQSQTTCTHLQKWAGLTEAQSGRDTDAEQVLEHHQTGGKDAVLRPHLPDGLPAATGDDGDQGAGVQQGVQVHPLANHVHRHHQAHLRQPMRTHQRESANEHAVPRTHLKESANRAVNFTFKLIN